MRSVPQTTYKMMSLPFAHMAMKVSFIKQQNKKS